MEEIETDRQGTIGRGPRLYSWPAMQSANIVTPIVWKGDYLFYFSKWPLSEGLKS